MIQELYNRLVKGLGRRARYASDQYWYIPDNEIGLLYILSWGPWTISRQNQVFYEAKQKYKEIGLPLHKINFPIHIYPLDWQNKYLNKIIEYLYDNNMTWSEFVSMLRQMGSKSKEFLYKLCDVEYSKVLSCIVRDIVGADSFPIDRRVRSFLQKHGLPVDEDVIIEMCRKEGIDPRIFNRLAYMNPRL